MFHESATQQLYPKLQSSLWSTTNNEKQLRLLSIFHQGYVHIRCGPPPVMHIWDWGSILMLEVRGRSWIDISWGRTFLALFVEVLFFGVCRLGCIRVCDGRRGFHHRVIFWFSWFWPNWISCIRDKTRNNNLRLKGQ